eukprot:4512974-Pyramimonas_sp.AAC.1
MDLTALVGPFPARISRQARTSRHGGPVTPAPHQHGPPVKTANGRLAIAYVPDAEISHKGVIEDPTQWKVRTSPS